MVGVGPRVTEHWHRGVLADQLMEEKLRRTPTWRAKCRIAGSRKTLKVRTLGCARRSLPPPSSLTHHDLKAQLVELKEQGTQEFILVRATDVV